MTHTALLKLVTEQFGSMANLTQKQVDEAVTVLKDLTDEDLASLKSGWHDPSYDSLFTSKNEFFSPAFMFYCAVLQEQDLRKRQAVEKRRVQVSDKIKRKVKANKDFFK